MSDELEAGFLASLGGLFKRKRPQEPVYENCRNCGEALSGRFCYACGQLSDDFHRPFWRLILESLNDLLALDGRAARTIPALLVRPGRVTRRYIDGQRARYVPPFRLYVLTSLLFFFLAFTFGPSDEALKDLGQQPPGEAQSTEPLTPEQQAILDESPLKIEDAAGDDESGELNLDMNQLPEAWRDDWRGETLKRMVDNLNELQKDPRLFWRTVQDWAPRMAMLLPLFTVFGLLVLYPFRKGVYVYDHLIVALHYQTFLYGVFVLGMLVDRAVDGLGLMLMVFGPPVYLYRMQREVYEGGRILTLLRTSILWISGGVVVLFLGAATLTTSLLTV